MAAWPHWLPLVIIAPLLGGVLTPAVSVPSRHVAKWWALAVMTLTSSCGLRARRARGRRRAVLLHPGGWEPPYGIELRFDEFSAVIAVVCLIGWLAVLYSFRYIEWLRCLARSASPTTTRCFC